MKKILSMLFAVLFAFSALHLTAFAAQESETADTAQASAEAFEVAAQAAYDKEGALQLAHSETYTVHYLKLRNGTNVSVPKGGHIEWGWQTEGGTIGAKSSADHKTCTVQGHHGGRVILLALVYDARGNVVSSDGVEIDVEYTGLSQWINNLTSGFYNSARIFLYNALSDLGFLIWNDNV